ncbi:MAG TPA: histidine ammonia-lyase [Candidatus Thermoplasmatota archaeon]|nr:histidine ammonia-lyase [Candidatus Thermoplasmatota archaeon]
MTQPVVQLDGQTLTLAALMQVARGGARCAVPEAARARMRESRAVVDVLVTGERPHYGITSGEKVARTRLQVEHMEPGGKVAYGITTGFGELARVKIAPEDVETLQRNLLLSHACGQGDPIPTDAVRAMLALRANALATGFSGVREEVVDLLVALLNERVHPVVYTQGSLGASGDLVPLAHAALVLIGEGEAEVDGQVLPAREALGRRGLKPVTLKAKEGLALINGTQFMSAHLALAVADGWNLVRHAELAAAMSLEALMGSERPMDPRIHAARPHRGQRETAAAVHALVSESGIMESHANCDRVQDAYTLRCIPQVLGAVRDVLYHAENVLQVEFNSATDNPLIFPGGDVLSGGNFHGEPLALLAAYLGPALAEVANFSERRVARLVDPHLSEGLPAFLTPRSGLNSGYMIPQYVAAGLVMENRILAHPAAVDSIPTSANQEDHVSNGAVGAVMVTRILRNAERAVALELLIAAQALDFRAPLVAGRGTRLAHAALRARIPALREDRYLKPEMDAATALLREGVLVEAVESTVSAPEVQADLDTV